MKKIISFFQRNYEGDRLVRDEIVPGAEWVANGEGVATRKWDGTCCMVRAGHLFKRYDVKQGRAAPLGFEPAQGANDVTGHQPGWLEVGNGNEDRWHREACGPQQNADAVELPDGTYELCGPKVQSNPEGFAAHVLVPHGADVLENVPRDFSGLKAYFERACVEGIVWHHPDGRMVKIKAKDFGYKRLPVATVTK